MILLIVILGLIIVYIILSFVFKKHKHITSSDMANTIERFVGGKSAEWEWDDFISSSIPDPILDKVRIRCQQLDKEFPPTQPGEYTNKEGLKILYQYITQLRSK